MRAWLLRNVFIHSSWGLPCRVLNHHGWAHVFSSEAANKELKDTFSKGYLVANAQYHETWELEWYYRVDYSFPI